MQLSLERLWHAEGAAAGTCILIDRAVDLVTPMCLQLTYEGLVDETLHITNGVVQLENAGDAKPSIACCKHMLYSQLWVLFWVAAWLWQVRPAACTSTDLQSDPSMEG